MQASSFIFEVIIQRSLMIEIPAVSVFGEGHIEQIRLDLIDDSVPPSFQIKTSKKSTDLETQLVLARKIACFLLTRPYVRPFISNTLENGVIVAEFEGQEAYQGGSFGLALLAGCLGLGFGIPFRQGRLFSAALTDCFEETGIPGGGCKLAPVKKLNQKIAAACLKRHQRFFFHGHEKAVLEFEQAYWRGDWNRDCLPCYLPEELPTASVLLLALDIDSLLQRIQGSEGEASFLAFLLFGMSKVGDDAFVQGISKNLARCRGEQRLDEKSTAHQELVNDMWGKRQNVPNEIILADLILNALQKSSSDEVRKSLIKAAISTDPKLPVFQPHIETDIPGTSDLDAWLDRPLSPDPGQFFLALNIMTLLTQLVPDMAPYWHKIKTNILTAIEQLLNHIISLPREEKGIVGTYFLQILNFRNLAGMICRLQPELIKDVYARASQCYNVLQKEGLQKASQECQKLLRNLQLHDLPTIFSQITHPPQDQLSLTFRLTDSKAQDRINDLEVVASGPENFELVVPSPVLLHDSCYYHYSGNDFCRRKMMTLADDTMGRVPFCDVQTLWDLFNLDYQPTRIGFQVHPDKSPATVKWYSYLSHWPPAIDSQLLASAMTQDTRAGHYRKLLDVGCGTGYLSIVAAHCWREIEELSLMDLNPLALAVARNNVETDNEARKRKIHTHYMDFLRFDGGSYDVLLCAPPYLPNRPVPNEGIELATNGTLLLEEVVKKGCRAAKEIWLVFSSIAWPNFQWALAQVPDGYTTVEILRQDFCPFRIPWLEPRTPREEADLQSFARRRKYYEDVLIPRGLIDMDNHASWWSYVKDNSAILPDNCQSKQVAKLSPDDIVKTLYKIEDNSRGYRFWHEVRTIRLTSRI